MLNWTVLRILFVGCFLPIFGLLCDGPETRRCFLHVVNSVVGFQLLFCDECFTTVSQVQLTGVGAGDAYASENLPLHVEYASAAEQSRSTVTQNMRPLPFQTHLLPEGQAVNLLNVQCSRNQLKHFSVVGFS